MKKTKWLLPILLAVTLIVGCNQTGTVKETDTPSATPTQSAELADDKDTGIQGEILEYFPMTENVLAKYNRTDNLVSQTSFPAFVQGNKMQRVTIAGENISTEVFEYENGEIKMNFGTLASTGFDNLLDMKSEYAITILKEPIQLGNSWETYSGTTIVGVAKGASTITDVNVEIKTPYKTLNCIEVTTEFESEYVNVDYYAKGYGLVQSGYFIKGYESEKFVSQNLTVGVSLSSYEEAAVFKKSLVAYYPNENVDGLNTAELEIDIKTNDDFAAIFTKILKNPTGNPNNHVITENTWINSIHVLWEEVKDPEKNILIDRGTLTVDLSQEFISEMNAGSGYETLILQALEATLSGFYSTDVFILTIDGTPYVSGH